MAEKINLFDKVNAVFNKQVLTKKELGKDIFMILRVLAMHQDYTASINRIQKYQGVLGHRMMILLREMFSTAEKAPFLDYVKKEDEYKRFSERANKTLRDLFFVSKVRLEEYMANLWITEEEITEIYGWL